MKRQRIVGFALVLMLVVSLFAGCGQDSTDSTTDNSNDNGNEATTPDETDTGDSDEASSDQTTIKWAVWDIASTTYYQPLIDAFEELNINLFSPSLPAS